MKNEKSKQLLKLLAKEIPISDLCQILDLKELEVMGEISRLKFKGNNISIVKKFNEVYVKNDGDNRLENITPYVIEVKGKNIKLGLISDTRYGSIYEQPSIINDVYKRGSEYGVDAFLHCGDISEGVYTSGKKELYMNTLFVHDVFSQSKNIVNNYPYIKNMNTYFITGEHDHTHLKQTKKDLKIPIDIGNEISKSREDLIYLGKNRREIQFINDNGTKLFNLLMQHPEGRIPYTVSYKPQQFMASIRSEDKPDILLHGHWLQAERLFFREIEEYSIPGLVATTPEMSDKGDQNTIGAWFLNIELDDKNNIQKVTPIFIPYYKTYDDDYKNVRKLTLGGK